ncbi:MAG TPA: glycosyltransferase, partial [Saprospiraceae bacterium]|nr:glycosyltransferase [Saprospiraceae bacterium]
MRIIFTVTNDLSFDQRMQRICTSLSDAGHEVILIGRNRKKSLPLRDEKYQQHRLSLIFDKGFLFYLEYQIRLFFYLLFRTKAVISSVDLDTILPCLLVAKLKRQTIVFDAHEYFSEVPEVIDRPFVKKTWERIADFCIPKVNQCYTVGNSLAEIFEKKYGKKFETIRNVPFSKKTNHPISARTSTPIILYQGMLNKGRGLEQVISAMHTIKNASLWLVGEGDLSQQLREQVNRESLSSKVKFLGFIPPDQLNETTQKAYIGLNLLENSGLSYYYSLANKTFDYIQAELPSIQMNFPEYQVLQDECHPFELIPNL